MLLRKVTIIFSLLRVKKSLRDFRESNQENKQRNDAINKAKKIKSDNFTRSNRENSNIAIINNRIAP